MINSHNIFIIGATGYIGKSLLKKINDAWNKVTWTNVYGTSSFDKGGLLSLRLEKPEEFNYDIIQPLDTILLSAAISSPDICAKEHEYARSVNVVGTSEFIKRAMDIGARVIFFSSDTVYGEQNEEFDESAKANPVGEYAKMKHEVETKFLGNPLFKSIRLSYVFSMNDGFTRYLSDCAKKGEVAELYHPFYRAIIHLEDVVDGVISLAQKWKEFPSNIINFGGPDVLSKVEITEIFQDLALNNLSFSVIKPQDSFFKKRPRIIRMQSPLLKLLLGRSAHTLKEATRIEIERQLYD